MKAKWMNLLLAAILILSMALPCFAADYTYTLTFYAGKQGSLSKDCVSVLGEGYQVEFAENKITVSGLHLGDRVTFHMEGVEIAEDSRYLVRGIRESGKDNSTVGLSDINVTGDQDFVVAYGIKGNLTQYTVNYRDNTGKALADSRTYYGNIGDAPVVPYLYFEGYRPAAYNITKVLSENSAENVFTFTYTKSDAATSTTATGSNAGTGTSATRASSTGKTPRTPATSNRQLGMDTPIAMAEPVELLDLMNKEKIDQPQQEASADADGIGNVMLYVGIGAAAIVAVGVTTYFILRAKRKDA